VARSLAPRPYLENLIVLEIKTNKHVMTKGYVHVMTKGKRSGKKFRLNDDGAKLHIYAIDRDRSLQADDATSRGAEVAL
jgi:hypothetical protein